MRKVRSVPIVFHPTKMILLSRLNPVAYNPRKISEADFKALKESIATVGFIDPIAVRKTGLEIIGGHQRRNAVLELVQERALAMPKIPCIVLDVDERMAKKLNVALNNVGGEFDAKKLGEVLASMHTREQKLTVDEVSFMGLELSEADRFLSLVNAETLIPPSTNPNPSTFANSVTLSLQFNDVRLRDAVKASLVAKAETTKQKTGDFVADLLGCKVA